MLENQLFTEKYRPKTIEDTILPERISSIFLKEQNNLSQHYLLYGNAGLGKTSVAKILAKNYPYLYINVSDESGVDIIRDRIVNFCSTISISENRENLKVVILDEMDGASDQFYKALRATIERFCNHVRFIGTCNYINKIPEAIQSRFVCINFNPVSKEEEKEIKIKYVNRIKKILSEQGIKIENPALIEFVKRNFPDLRSMVNKIQLFKTQGINNITIDNIKQSSYSFIELFKLCISQPDPVNNYKIIMSNYSNKIDDVMNSLGSEFVEYIKEFHEDKISKIPNIIIKVAHYQSQRLTVIDPCVSLLALFFEIQIILNN